MKHTRKANHSLSLLAGLVCAASLAAVAVSDGSPAIGITNPSEGQSFTTGALIPLQAVVTNNGATATRVDFQANGAALGPAQPDVHGEWTFPDTTRLSVMSGLMEMLDYVTPALVWFGMDGHYTSPTNFTGTFTTFVSGSPVGGAVTVAVSFDATGRMAADIVGDAPLGHVTLSSGQNQHNEQAYWLDWAGASPGTYALTATAAYGASQTVTSAPVHITVGSALPGPVDFSDDFSTGVNTNLWKRDGNDPLYSLIDTNGEIRFTRPSGGDYSFKYIGLNFDRQVLGDFDISVDFRGAAIARADGSPGNQVQLNARFGGQLFAVVRSDEDGYGNNAHLYRDPPAQWVLPPTYTAVTDGTMRLTRTGAVVTAYFNGAVLHSGTYNTNPVTALTLSLQNNGTRDATAVTFDNFHLRADRLVPKPARLQSLGTAGNQLQLRLLNPTPGAWHWVEYTPVLPPTNGWTVVGKIVGGAFATNWSDTLPSGMPAGFHRVQSQ